MKTGTSKKDVADKLRAAYLERTVGEQLTVIQSRPGQSNRELERLQGWLKLQGVTKRSKIQEVIDLLHPKKEEGYTVVELLIIVVLVLIVLLIGASILFTNCRGAGTSTIANAEEFARKIDPKATVDCTTRDTDGDGYVSCTVFRPGNTPLGIECASRFSLNDGCRVARVPNLGQVR